MARKDQAAVATKEPADLYDSLSQEGQDVFDSIALLGYTPEQGMAGLWFARKPGALAKDAIGPADSLQALHSIVKEKVTPGAPTNDVLDEDEHGDVILENVSEDLNDPEMIELEDDGAGNKYLPGTGPKVIKALAFAIRNYDEIKLQRVELSGREGKAKKDLKLVLKKYERFLETDEETGEKFYVVGKVRGKIAIKKEEVFLTDHVVEEED